MSRHIRAPARLRRRLDAGFLAQTAVRPVGSAGLFIPWEVVGGIGGGIAAAGLVLFAMRKTSSRSLS